MSMEPRISAAAMATLGLGLVQAMLVAAGRTGLFPVGITMIGATGIAGLAVGVFALMRIKKSGGRLKGKALALAGMAISLLSVAVLLLMLAPIAAMER